MARPVDVNQAGQEPSVIKEDRSLADLFSQLSQETTTLVHQEVELAKTELTHKAARLGKDVGFLVAGGAVGYAGLLALIATIVLALDQAGLPWWLSALVVSLIVAGIGGALVWKGLNNLKRERITPEETIETLKEDAAWAKEQTK